MTQPHSPIVAAVRELQDLRRAANALPRRSAERYAMEQRVETQRRRVWALTVEHDPASG